MPLPRLGIAVDGSFSAATWSGIPIGLARGLEENGASVVPLTPYSGWLRRGASLVAQARFRSKSVAAHAPETAYARSVEFNRTLKRHRRDGDVSGVVQIGSGFSLSEDVYETGGDLCQRREKAGFRDASHHRREYQGGERPVMAGEKHPKLSPRQSSADPCSHLSARVADGRARFGKVRVWLSSVMIHALAGAMHSDEDS